MWLVDLTALCLIFPVLGIDPDGQLGIKKVDKNSVIRFLRGPDIIGSVVKLQVSKHSTKEVLEFSFKRADFRSGMDKSGCVLMCVSLLVKSAVALDSIMAVHRSVDKVKEVYLKLAALLSAVKVSLSCQKYVIQYLPASYVALLNLTNTVPHVCRRTQMIMKSTTTRHTGNHYPPTTSRHVCRARKRTGKRMTDKYMRIRRRGLGDRARACA